MSSPAQRLRDNATEVVSMLVTGIWLVALFAGWNWWLPFMLFGYIVIVPVTAILFGDTDDIEEWVDEESTTSSNGSQTNPEHRAEGGRERDEEDVLQVLRDRYARGELTDEQFERKVERLLETETLEDIEDTYRTETGDAHPEREPERE